MSREFVRNIKNTKITGDKIEPLYTNIQNDLLSDDEDVAVRNQDDYHLLTDNLKTLETKVGQFLSISNVTKNGLTISGVKATREESENGNDVSKIMNALRTKQAIDFQVPLIVDEITTPKFEKLENDIQELETTIIQRLESIENRLDDLESESEPE